MGIWCSALEVLTRVRILSIHHSRMVSMGLTERVSTFKDECLLFVDGLVVSSFDRLVD